MCFVVLVCVFFAESHERSYHVNCTRSRPIPEVKLRRVQPVVRCVSTCEAWILFFLTLALLPQRNGIAVALHCTYMSVLTCSFTVRSVCFRTSPANVSVHFSLEMHLEHSYHCVVFLSVHSSNSTLVLFCLVTLSKPSFSSITTALPGSSLFAPTRARAKTTISIFGYLAQTFEVLQHVCSIENHQQQEEAIQAFQVF